MVLGHQDKWRHHPFLANCVKKPLPGFGIAVGLFTVYLIGDKLFTGKHNKQH